MTTRAEAIKAADVYKANHEVLEAVKTAASQTEKAKKVLGAYMVEHDISVFRGVTLTIVPFSGWDYDSLTAYLGDRESEFRMERQKKYFGLVRRIKPKPGPSSE